MTLTISLPRIHIAPGSYLTIPDVSWEDFTTLLAELGEKRHSRLVYYQGYWKSCLPSPCTKNPIA